MSSEESLHLDDVNDLKKHLKQIKSLQSQLSDHSSILDSMEQTATELREVRDENIALKSQLRLANESNKLMEAEFAFQREEMQLEIERLKKEEQELQKALLESRNPKNSQRYDVNARVEIGDNKKDENEEMQSRLELYETKYRKWKEIAKKLKENSFEDKYRKWKEIAKKLKENSFEDKYRKWKEIAKKLKENSFEDKYRKWKEIAKKLKEDYENMKTENEQENEEKMGEEFGKVLKEHIEHWKRRVERRNREIGVIRCEEEKEKNRLNDIIVQQSNALLITEERLSKLKAQLEKQKAKLQNMDLMQKRVNDLLEINAHFDSERQVLSDILGVEDIDPNEQWVELRKAVREGVNAIQKLTEAEQKLADANQQLSDLSRCKRELRELQEKYSNAIDKQKGSKELQERLATTEEELIALRNAMNRTHLFSEQQRIRLLFAKRIADGQNALISEINQLEKAVSGSEEPTHNFRSVVLTVVFLHIWKRNLNNSEFDPTSLTMWSTEIGHSVGQQIKSIRDRFVDLSKDLLTTKSQLLSSKSELQQVQRQFLESGGDIERTNVQLMNMKKQLKQYKVRFAEIVEENANMISPQKFEEVLTQVTDAELVRDAYERDVAKQRSELDEKAAEISELSIEIKRHEVRNDANVAEISRLNALIEKQNTEIAILRAKVNDRTKEFLALERKYVLGGGSICYQVHETLEETENQTPVNPTFLHS